MNDEELKYYKELQPLFKEKMGEIQDGDRYLIEVLPNDWRPEVHGMRDGYSGGNTTVQQRIRQGYNILLVPLPIDPVNPERGLLKMIDLSYWRITIQANGNFYIHRDYIDITDTPTLALLKALAHQQELLNNPSQDE